VTDFQATLDELGEDVFGAAWLAYRPLVARWVERNPERVAWLCQRIRRRVREGRL
jgi:hypothetical protein